MPRGAVWFICPVGRASTRAGLGTLKFCEGDRGDAAEPLFIAGITFQNALECHELQIILMRSDAQVRDAFECAGNR